MKCTDKTVAGQLSRLGWNSHFQTQMENEPAAGLIPARVTGVMKNTFRINNGEKELTAATTGRLKYDNTGLYPVTGDWVLMADTVITRILDRKNVLTRGASGTHSRQDSIPQKEQVIAANLDTVFIVSGLDRDFNLRRIERYLTLVYNCGLNPVIILTKADLQEDPDLYVSDVETVAFGVPIHLVSARDDAGLTALTPYLAPGLTVTMMGSSGAGKSTLLNRLYGKDLQTTGQVSTHVGKGTHTTTSRDLIVMPQGGMIIDNPGIREISFWDVDQGIESAFPEIDAFAAKCRFSDCTHAHEPGCRVLEAVREGEITMNRLENFRKMKRELDYLASRRDKSADRVEKERWKDVALKIRGMKKKKLI